MSVHLNLLGDLSKCRSPAPLTQKGWWGAQKATFQQPCPEGHPSPGDRDGAVVGAGLPPGDSAPAQPAATAQPRLRTELQSLLQPPLHMASPVLDYCHRCPIRLAETRESPCMAVGAQSQCPFIMQALHLLPCPQHPGGAWGEARVPDSAWPTHLSTPKARSPSDALEVANGAGLLLGGRGVVSESLPGLGQS